MKKLLIIQQDEAYFLFETLQVIESNPSAFKDFETTILVSNISLSSLTQKTSPLITGIQTDPEKIRNQTFDISVNLSLTESSWDLHGEISSTKKLGPYRIKTSLHVDDLWSSYLLTLKGKAPFLTFHLQDIYKNILGIKNLSKKNSTKSKTRQIVFGNMNPKYFSPTENEILIHEIASKHSQIPLKLLSEIDIISDVSATLYIGPATLESLRFCEAGGKGIFLTSHFQGLNLLPSGGNHKIISSRNSSFLGMLLFPLIDAEIMGEHFYDIPYSVYEIDPENIFGTYLKSLNKSDDTYPIYQSHVVLWNFLLNLYDTNLEITSCNEEQIDLLKSNKEVLEKLIRLHDYAMASINTIYHEAKANLASGDKINGHINNLIEIEKASDRVAQSHSMIRPILDFYKIRRGQNNGETLVDQSQISYLTYTEEHQALQALDELFSVTLSKNETNI